MVNTHFEWEPRRDGTALHLRLLQLRWHFSRISWRESCPENAILWGFEPFRFVGRKQACLNSRFFKKGNAKTSSAFFSPYQERYLNAASLTKMLEDDQTATRMLINSTSLFYLNTRNVTLLITITLCKLSTLPNSCVSLCNWPYKEMFFKESRGFAGYVHWADFLYNDACFPSN